MISFVRLKLPNLWQYDDLSVFLETRRQTCGISINTLCRCSHISKKTYLAFRRGQYRGIPLDWFFRLMHGFRQTLADKEEFDRLWGEVVVKVLGKEG